MAFKLIIQIMHAMGMWALPGESLFYWGYTVFLVSAYMIFALVTSLNIIPLWGQIEMVDSLSVLLTNATALTKMFVLLTSRRRIDRLVAFIEEEFETGPQEVTHKSQSKARKLSVFYVGMFTSTIVLWSIWPLTVSDPSERNLPFKIWIPFNTSTSPTYELAYLLESCTSITYSISIALIDTFYLILIIHSSCLFQILQVVLRNVANHKVTAENRCVESKSTLETPSQLETYWKTRKGKKSTDLPQILEESGQGGIHMPQGPTNQLPIRAMKMRKRATDHLLRWKQMVLIMQNQRKIEKKIHRNLIRCIEKHQATLKHCDELEELMSPIIFIEYLVTSLNLCLVGFQVTMVSISTYSVKFIQIIAYSICLLIQLYFLCLYGSELMVQSTEVLDAAYDCKWYDCSGQFKRAVLMVIMRAKRPVKLTAGKFGTLTLERFNELIQAAYSYFALLRQLSEKKNV